MRAPKNKLSVSALSRRPYKMRFFIGDKTRPDSNGGPLNWQEIERIDGLNACGESQILATAAAHPASYVVTFAQPSRLRVYGASSRRLDSGDGTSPELASEDACTTFSSTAFYASPWRKSASTYARSPGRVTLGFGSAFSTNLTACPISSHAAVSSVTISPLSFTAASARRMTSTRK